MKDAYHICQYEYHDLSKINGFDELCKDSVSNSIIYQRIKQSLLTLTYLTQKTQRHPGLGQAQRGEVKPVYGIPIPSWLLNHQHTKLNNEKTCIYSLQLKCFILDVFGCTTGYSDFIIEILP